MLTQFIRCSFRPDFVEVCEREGGNASLALEKEIRFIEVPNEHCPSLFMIGQFGVHSSDGVEEHKFC
jgi:hypothetical protein